MLDDFAAVLLGARGTTGGRSAGVDADVHEN
jgi:hypothetical protein